MTGPASPGPPARATPVWERPWTLAGLVAALVALTGRFTFRSWFTYDDFVYLLDAQRHGLSLSLLAKPLNVHFSPAHRLADWLLQTFFPLHFGVAQVFLLACFAATLVVLHRVLTELVGKGAGPLVLTGLYGTSVLNVGLAQYWASGLQSLPSGVLSLLAVLFYLRYHRTRDRRLLVASAVCVGVALLFYVKPLLVPLYLVLARVLLLSPDQPVRRCLMDTVRGWREWVPFLVPVGLYLLLYLTRYWEPSGTTSWAAVDRYLRDSWARVFAPGFVGFRLPEGELSEGQQAVIVGVQALMAATVVASLVRAPRAWRAWAFFAVAFLANALLVGLPRLGDFGPGVSSQLRYYAEANYLFPVALGAAFLLPWPRRPALLSGAGGWRKVAWAGLGLGFAAHLGVAWWGAGRVSAESPGSTTRAFLGRLDGALRRAEGRKEGVAVVDGRFPEHVFGVPPPYGYRYSEILPLMRPDVAFDDPRRSLHRVTEDASLEPVRFRAHAGGDVRALVRDGRVRIAGGTVEEGDGPVCVSSTTAPASLELRPEPVLAGGGWYMDLRYSSTVAQAVPLAVDRGQGFPYLDRALAIRRGAGQATLADLGGPAVTGVRLELPRRSRTCLDRLDVGLLVPAGAAPGRAPGDGPTSVHDGFDRPDHAGGLGAVQGGPSWRADAGVWGIAASSAYVSAPGPGRNLAVAQTGGGDGQAQVRLARVVDGAGLLVRYRDPANHWAVVAVPGYATWAVVRTVGGREEVVANTGLSAVADGTTVGAVLDGDTMTVLVHGSVTTTVSDPALAGAGAAGMTTSGSGAGVARFDDFSFSAPGPR